MDIPKKIYVADATFPDFVDFDGSPINTKRIDDHDIEYIRTDCFVENVQLFLIDKLKEIPMGNGKMKIKSDCSLEEFIDEFRNYMKGE